MLHWAAGKNHVELCKYLLRLQADVNAQDRRKRTALDIAKEKGNLEVIAVLENSEAYKDLDETSSESAEDVSELSEDDDDDPPENTASKSSRRATIHASTMEQEVTLWLEEVTGCEKKGKRSFAEWLRDGQVLCQAVNAVQPGTISKINTQATAFKQMENITLFTRACSKFGVLDKDLFNATDLNEEKNLQVVLNCIYNFASVIRTSVPTFQGSFLGVEHNAKVQDSKLKPGHWGQLKAGAALMGLFKGTVAKATMDAGSDAEKAVTVPTNTPAGGSDGADSSTVKKRAVTFQSAAGSIMSRQRQIDANNANVKPSVKRTVTFQSDT